MLIESYSPQTSFTEVFYQTVKDYIEPMLNKWPIAESSPKVLQPTLQNNIDINFQKDIANSI